jgi:hypothetical protein
VLNFEHHILSYIPKENNKMKMMIISGTQHTDVSGTNKEPNITSQAPLLRITPQPHKTANVVPIHHMKTNHQTVFQSHRSQAMKMVMSLGLHHSKGSAPYKDWTMIPQDKLEHLKMVER